MWQRFTEEARKVIFYAQEDAGRLGQNAVGPEHFLLAVLHSYGEAGGAKGQEPSVAVVVLQQLGVDPAALYAETKATCALGDGRSGQDMQLTPAAKRVIDLAYDEAKQLKHPYIGTEHLLLGMLRETEGIEFAILTNFGVTLDAVRRKLPELLAAKSALKEHLLSLDEAVKYLGTSKPTLYRLLGQNEISGLKVGRQWRFRIADLVAYTERRSQAPHQSSAPAPSAEGEKELDAALATLAARLEQDAAERTSSAESKTALLTDMVLRLALEMGASDIHWEPTPTDLLMRLRVDGVLQEIQRFPARLKEPLTAQIKSLAGLAVSETQHPQDGSFLWEQDGADTEIRVSVLPSRFGAALTLRIVQRSAVLLSLDTLGLAPEEEARIRGFLRGNNGMLLAAGPAGSGKTTLLFACLQAAAGPEKKTLAIEDAPEYQMPYLTPLPTNPKAGLTAAALLRAALGQDPDLMLAGDLRDLDTAQAAAEAARTGPLVLASVPAADAPSALAHLLDLGLEPYLVAGAVKIVVAVRLARRLCDACKQPADVPEALLSHLAPLAAEGGYQVPDGTVFFQAAGCEQCRGRGYVGHIGLYEALTVTEPLAEAIVRRAPAEELRAVALGGGMRTLLADGFQKAAAGLTTVEEALQVLV